MRYRATWLTGALVVVLVATVACSSDTSPVETVPRLGSAQYGADGGLVAPELEGEEFLVQVILTDSGYQPPIIQLPAGRRVRLVLRNHGTTEHHFRVVGLIASEIRWFLEPEIDISDLDGMTDEELADAGLAGEDTTDEEEMEHILHHLSPQFVPYKEASAAGIKPLPNEVHGYVDLGVKDVLTFYPLSTGRFMVEDVLHPEITGTVVVFLAESATPQEPAG